jgi:hypothetical protein
MKICKYTDCDNKILAKNMCKLHYQRNYRKEAKSICVLDDCGLPVLSSGLCNRHYLRKIRKKNITEKSCFERSPFEQLHYYVKKSDNGCWIYTGGLNRKGYGSIVHNKKKYIAHRFSYEIYKQDFDSSLHVLHHCDNPICVNPDHLFQGTDLDNSIDKINKGRFVSCLGSKNGMSKLTEKDVMQIKKFLAQKKSCSHISKMFGVTDVTISCIKHQKTWRHIPNE